MDEHKLQMEATFYQKSNGLHNSIQSQSRLLVNKITRTGIDKSFYAASPCPEVVARPVVCNQLLAPSGSDSDGTRLLTGTPATMSGGQVNTYPRHVFIKLNEKLMFDGSFQFNSHLYIITLTPMGLLTGTPATMSWIK